MIAGLRKPGAGAVINRGLPFGTPGQLPAREATCELEGSKSASGGLGRRGISPRSISACDLTRPGQAGAKCFEQVTPLAPIHQST